MSSSGASASAAAKQRHQEQLRADTSALVDAARGQRQMPELPPYVPEFDLAFMSQMLGVGAVRSEPEDPATGDDETIMQEAAVDVALQLLTDGEGLQALLASDEPTVPRELLVGTPTKRPRESLRAAAIAQPPDTCMHIGCALTFAPTPFAAHSARTHCRDE